MIVSIYPYRIIKDIISAVIAYIDAAAEETRDKETGI